MEIRARMREGADGRWMARAESHPPVEVSGSSQDRCIAALRRTLKRSRGTTAAGEPNTLVVEVLPLLAGVAEAAQVMGWDKRRVITYIDRGSFPAPAQSLASVGHAMISSMDKTCSRDCVRIAPMTCLTAEPG